MEQQAQSKENSQSPVRQESGTQLRAVKPASEPSSPPAKRKAMVMGLRIAVAGAVVLAAVTGWWGYARQFEDTDDAQTDANISAVSPRVSGTVIAVHVVPKQRTRRKVRGCR